MGDCDRSGHDALDHGRTHPLEAWTDAFAALPESVGISVEPYVAMVDVRLVDPTAWPEVALPTTPNTWVSTAAGRAIWLGPDEWLLTSTAEAPDELEARVRDAVLPLGGSAADVSAQRITLRLRGTRIRDVLAKGCAIDLHPRVFTRGSSAQTTLGLAGVVLLALADEASNGRLPSASAPAGARCDAPAPSASGGDDFVVLVRSSFAGYLAEWLLDAALEYTMDPVAPVPSPAPR